MEYRVKYNGVDFSRFVEIIEIRESIHPIIENNIVSVHGGRRVFRGRDFHPKLIEIEFIAKLPVGGSPYYNDLYLPDDDPLRYAKWFVEHLYSDEPQELEIGHEPERYNWAEWDSLTERRYSIYDAVLVGEGGFTRRGDSVIGTVMFEPIDALARGPWIEENASIPINLKSKFESDYIAELTAIDPEMVGGMDGDIKLWAGEYFPMPVLGYPMISNKSEKDNFYSRFFKGIEHGHFMPPTENAGRVFNGGSPQSDFRAKYDKSIELRKVDHPGFSRIGFVTLETYETSLARWSNKTPLENATIDGSKEVKDEYIPKLAYFSTTQAEIDQYLSDLALEGEHTISYSFVIHNQGPQPLIVSLSGVPSGEWTQWGRERLSPTEITDLMQQSSVALMSGRNGYSYRIKPGATAAFMMTTGRSSFENWASESSSFSDFLMETFEDGVRSEFPWMFRTNEPLFTIFPEPEIVRVKWDNNGISLYDNITSQKDYKFGISDIVIDLKPDDPHVVLDSIEIPDPDIVIRKEKVNNGRGLQEGDKIEIDSAKQVLKLNGEPIMDAIDLTSRFTKLPGDKEATVRVLGAKGKYKTARRGF